ncbi:MAG TPA: putative glycolipid-binding domain-containing protein [Actinomycetota bacterium]|jgi:hypothetical protein|nr:putative glycolipid-binding domain-containing protein [Actinomycetota bacterium]
MPSGRYVVLGDDGEPVGTEDFRCAPGPAGWRYFSEIDTIEHGAHHEIVDVAVDADWRPVRLRVDTGAHDLLLEGAGDALAGFRDRARVEHAWGSETHLDYLTPATNLITTKRLTGTAEIQVLFVEPFTLEARPARQRYELLGEERVDTPVGRFDSTRWRYTALDSGWTGDLWVAGDVVVAYEGTFRLESYDPGAKGPRPS